MGGPGRGHAPGGASTYDVIVIGGGASGLAAAITSARAGARTAIIERDVEAGLPILATGNGRCNISNARLDARRYRHPEAARALFGGHPERDVEAFLSSVGIATAEEGEGRLYPLSRRADSVRDALLATCAREGVDIIACAKALHADVDEVGMHRLLLNVPDAHLAYRRGRDARAQVRNARKALAGARLREKAMTARTLVLACGGVSRDCCQMLGLPHLPEEPVLCPIACTLDVGVTRALELLDGLRVEGMLTLMRDGAAIAFEQGETLFRPYGISGIAAFNLSRRIKPGDLIELDLFPTANDTDLAYMLADRAGAIGAYTGDPRWLDGLLARPLADIVSEAVAGSTSPLESMASLLHHLRLRVGGTTEHAQAQVRRGGIPLNALDLGSLAVTCRTGGATPQPPIHACGEALDMDADCGGYNLAWAWLSGIRAGERAADAATSGQTPHEETHA